MLVEAYRHRGHSAQIREPIGVFRSFVSQHGLAKWAGYIDQYIIFFLQQKLAMRRDPPNTLYVLCDQALGLWVPLFKDRPHIIHCHDLLALRSALGLVKNNPTSISGKIYQRMIRWGFSSGKYFISISQKTKVDLHSYGYVSPLVSEVVYNGLNYAFKRVPRAEALATLGPYGHALKTETFILHVGGGQWYKNTEGVLAIYAEHARRQISSAGSVLPLWIVSPQLSERTMAAIAALPVGSEVKHLSNISPAVLEAAYSIAAALLFPSHEEGFGWPIAEAMACGCPVITTNSSPMTEVGGDLAHYVPKLADGESLVSWAKNGADHLREVLSETSDGGTERVAQLQQWARRFDASRAIDQYLAIYELVMASAGSNKSVSSPA